MAKPRNGKGKEIADMTKIHANEIKNVLAHAPHNPATYDILYSSDSRRYVLQSVGRLRIIPYTGWRCSNVEDTRTKEGIACFRLTYVHSS